MLARVVSRRLHVSPWLVVMAVLLSTSLTGAETPPGSNVPPMSAGASGSRGTDAKAPIGVEGDRYVFAASPTRVIELTKDLSIARVQVDRTFHEFDPPPKLAWPLQVGKSGVAYGTWRWTGNNSSRAGRFSWTVEAYEDVVTPAGKFKAFRIRFNAAIGINYGRDIVVWYSPDARQLIKGQHVNYGGLDGILTFDVIALRQSSPVTIALRDPTDDLATENDTLTLAGKVFGGKGIGVVTATLNGREVWRTDDKQRSKNDVDIAVPVKLVPGKNVLLVTATDVSGDSRQEARTVFFNKRAPPVVASTPGPKTPADAPPSRTPEQNPVNPPKAAPDLATPSTPLPTTAPRTPATEQKDATAAPFRVHIAAPIERAKLENERMVVAGFAAGGKGVSRLQVTVNGIEIARQEERTPQRAIPINAVAKLQEGVNTVVVTAIDADGAPHQEIRTVEYEKPVPLTVVVRFPSDGATLNEATTVVAASVASSKGIDRVSVSVNGVEAALPDAPAGRRDQAVTPRAAVTTARQKAITMTVPVTLRDGKNLILVSATEPDGTARQVLHTVTYRKPVVQEAPAPPAAAVPNRWAVVIGVGDYENKNIAKLRYTVNDAEVLYRTITGPGGFKKEHVLLLTDKTERKPTLRNIKWALGTFLARSAKRDDTVLIFFAGHGAPEIDQRGLERDGLAKYLVPSDADADDLYSTALPMDELQNVFSRIEAERLVVFLDACYSGAAGGRTFAA